MARPPPHLWIPPHRGAGESWRGAGRRPFLPLLNQIREASAAEKRRGEASAAERRWKANANAMAVGGTTLSRKRKKLFTRGKGGFASQECLFVVEIERSHSGLDSFAVAAIPTMSYSSEAFHSKDDAQCSICLGEYKDKEILRIMPTCRHNFHLECIDVWLQKQTTCPICRISLRDQSSTKSTASPLRGLPQLLGHPESSAANRSPHWILPIHRDRTGARQNRPTSQESLEVIIEIQPQRH